VITQLLVECDRLLVEGFGSVEPRRECGGDAAVVRRAARSGPFVGVTLRAISAYPIACSGEPSESARCAAWDSQSRARAASASASGPSGEAPYAST
jgi:hypothetical protein